MLPIPSPATTQIIRRAGLSVLLSPLSEELTTPTGAAILAALTGGRTSPPPFRLVLIGTGIGSRRLDFPNILRVMVGESEGERISLVECNVDDLSGEVLGWLPERLKGVAEDVSFTPIFMKKCRPGFTVRVVVRPEFINKAVDIIMREVGTLGVKVLECKRIKAEREISEEVVKIGKGEYKVRVKRSRGISRLKPEYEDLKQIAVNERRSLREVMEEVTRQVTQKYMHER
ncbi:MAG: LarC family nickel insertion protein [Candidatus Methanomethylicaceae archaeon]